MTDYVPADRAHDLLDEAHRLAEAGKYEAAASIYTSVGRAVLDMSADHGKIDDGTRAAEKSDLSLVNASHDGRALYDEVTDWYSDLRSDYDIVLEPRDGGPGGPGDGPGGPDDDGPGGDPGDDGPDDGYGRSLGVSVDVWNTDDAMATDDEPFEPEYSVNVTAMADSEDEAREYVRQTLRDSDDIVMNGIDARAGLGSTESLGRFDVGSYDPDRLLDSFGRGQRQTSGDTTYWTYTVDLPSISSAVDAWEIGDEGRYMVQAAFVDGGDDVVNGAAGVSDWFYVGAPDEGEGGETGPVQAAIHRSEDTDEAEELRAQQLGDPSGGPVDQFFSLFNASSSPNYTLELRTGADSEDEVKETLENLDDVTLRMIASEDRIQVGDDHYRPVEAGEEDRIALTYDRGAGDPDADGALVNRGRGIAYDVDIMGGSAFVDNPLPHEFEDGGQYDLGVDVYAPSDGAGRELVEQAWTPFDAAGASRMEVMGDIASVASYLNQGGAAQEEDGDGDHRLITRAHEHRKKHGGVFGAVNNFLQLDADEISNHMAGDVLWNLPPFNAFKDRWG